LETGLLGSFCGGILIGIAAGLFMLLNGRIAGISGVVRNLLTLRDSRWRDSIAFLVGLPLGLLAWRAVSGQSVPVHVTHSLGLLSLAGLLVGVGTGLGNGCTSGHGICGLARLSRRSLVATGLFMAVAIVVVSVMRGGQ